MGLWFVIYCQLEASWIISLVRFSLFWILWEMHTSLIPPPKRSVPHLCPWPPLQNGGPPPHGPKPGPSMPIFWNLLRQVEAYDILPTMKPRIPAAERGEGIQLLLPIKHWKQQQKLFGTHLLVLGTVQSVLMHSRCLYGNTFTGLMWNKDSNILVKEFKVSALPL